MTFVDWAAEPLVRSLPARPSNPSGRNALAGGRPNWGHARLIRPSKAAPGEPPMALPLCWSPQQCCNNLRGRSTRWNHRNLRVTKVALKTLEPRWRSSCQDGRDRVGSWPRLRICSDLGDFETCQSRCVQKLACEQDINLGTRPYFPRACPLKLKAPLTYSPRAPSWTNPPLA